MTDLTARGLLAAQAEHHAKLVREGGAGWDEYVVWQADLYARQDPDCFGGLPQATADAIRACGRTPPAAKKAVNPRRGR